MILLFSLHVLAATQFPAVLAQDCRNTLKATYTSPIAAGGWTYRLIANGFTRPRSILFDDQGALLVVDANSGVKHLKLTDDGGTCLSVAEKQTIIDSPELNHGIALSPDGKTLYASTADKVYSWPYDSIAATVGDRNRTLIANMSNTDHTTRTLLLSSKMPGMLLVSRGSASNIDDGAISQSTGHAQLRAFDIGGLDKNSGPFNFPIQGTILGWGLRNSVGVAEEPVTGGIWTVENSADQLRRNNVDIHTDNPAEELNFHGRLIDSTKDQGGNYGYPNCFAVWSTEGFPNRGNMTTGDQFTLNPSPTLNDTTCNSAYVPPRLSFQAHTAPLDIKFTPDGSEAFVTFHGSWNRDEAIGYKLSSVRFSNGEPIEPADSRTPITDVLSNADTSSCPDNCFRPVGLAWDSQQRLFMTSDSTGEIYVLQRTDSPLGSHFLAALRSRFLLSWEVRAWSGLCFAENQPQPLLV
ncbi:soluble quino protein glucose/sorbosone dehydrogenase [Colletotrichum godetiae]|uniref:Soluble quino protein glucose/sorbosone dehydrogenase n=1 Tax=Colletotrichum godetiae TaxID=1209918 RepID=A0AAJ0AFE8_9PEZI|nr:soluble quino protein glucose/sorbosone dehydrogenase [Colletotrichum godetiae]KAK1672896.1 soluble quino protein glucose/sorbosone dehydrogenase [Colletotrichum godetiae]